MSDCILVVEDNLLNRQLVRDVLELHGYEILEAGSVDEGRASLTERRPALVLLDIGIPGGGGEKLLAEIRADGDLKTLPVIAVTAFAMSSDRDRLLALGFDGYLSKPIDVRQFPKQVAEYLDKLAR